MIGAEAADAKPLDLGSGRVCASFDLRSAAWLSIGGPHPTHGFVELSALPSFEETGRGDPTATRQHRLAMTRPDHAFLRVELDGGLPELTPDPRDPGAPRWTSDLVEVRATTEPDALTIRQAWSVAARSDARPSVAIRLRGALDQPALAEITELDPPRPTGAISSFALGEAAVTITASALPAEAAVTVRGARVTWTSADGEMLGTVAWPDGETRLDLILSVALSGLTRPADPNCALGSDDDDPIVARADLHPRLHRAPAWFSGARPGLGSTHTPGPWTLGDIQAWVRARIVGEPSAMEESLGRLHEVAFVDGMLPEAYTAAPDGDRRIRHWFAWPGAALAALLLLDRRGRLEERLSARRAG